LQAGRQKICWFVAADKKYQHGNASLLQDCGKEEIDGTLFLSEFNFSGTHCFMMCLAADVTSGCDVFLFKGNWFRGYSCCESAV